MKSKEKQYDYLKAISPIIKKAGLKALSTWSKFDRKDSSFKGDREIVTKTDKDTEKNIIKAISKLFPEHSFLGEESGTDSKESDYVWIIDPIDGTTNFSIHNPLWSISVGLAYQGEIIFGLIYIPVIDEIFSAAKGKGAKLNNKKLFLRNKLPNLKAVHTFCHGYRDRDIKVALNYYLSQKTISLDCRQLGSAAIELCFVAAGRVDSLIIPGARAWDVAAGYLIAKEAGASVTDFNGKEWNLKSKDIAVCHNGVKKQVLATLKKAEKM